MVRRTSFVVGLLFAVLIGGGWLRPAAAIIILSEDFNDVTDLSTAASVRTVSNILTNNPSQLPQVGTTLTNLTGTTLGLTAAINVRRGDNVINTVSNPAGFRNPDSFTLPADATNRFLVLGDSVDTITSTVSPAGPDAGTFRINFPFEVPAGLTDVTVTLDWAFRGINPTTTTRDLWQIFLDFGTINQIDLLPPTSSLGRARPQQFSDNILSPGLHWLTLRLIEQPGSATNTAVAVDNILIEAEPAIPEPTTVVLTTVGLAALLVTRRRKRAA